MCGLSCLFNAYDNAGLFELYETESIVKMISTFHIANCLNKKLWNFHLYFQGMKKFQDWNYWRHEYLSLVPQPLCDLIEMDVRKLGFKFIVSEIVLNPISHKA